MDFIAKHTSNKFCLVDNVRTSVRELIAREVVSNILVHRDFKKTAGREPKIEGTIRILQKKKTRKNNYGCSTWFFNRNMQLEVSPSRKYPCFVIKG